MKVFIWCDERYPDYGVATNVEYHGRAVEVSDEFYAECRSVAAAYEAMQNKLEALAKAQTKLEPPAQPKLTDEERARIVAETPVESPESIQSAISAFETRKTKAA